jgi:hypothetical protein
MKLPTWAATWVCLGLALELGAQGVEENRSFTDLELEVTESQLNLQTVVQENRTLRHRLEESREAVRELTQSLAVANGEADVFRREAAELKLRMEALGLESVDEDRAGLERRLLKAVRDLQLVSEEKEKLSEQLVRLSEALLHYLKTAESSDAEARMTLEAELRGAGKLLGTVPAGVNEGTPVASTLTEAMVISFKDEYQLVVANVGSEHGVRMGMPFEIWRDKALIGRALVVDVREKICGAVK